MSEPYEIIIGNKKVRTEKIVDVHNPYDQSVVGEHYVAGNEEIDRAVELARLSSLQLKKIPIYKKAEILSDIANELAKNKYYLADIISKESGKPITLSKAEVERAIFIFRYTISELETFKGEYIPLDIYPAGEKRYCITKRFPIGTVLSITPFNFPLMLAIHKLAPALAIGNPVILKPPPQTPLSQLILGDILTKIDLPDGSVSVLPCDLSCAEKLVRHDEISMISFTGSCKAGWHIKSIAGKKKVTLEMGGNAGVIVDKDVDMNYCVKRLVTGAFANAGQICISVQRIFVHSDIYDVFCERFVEETQKIHTGDPLDEKVVVGPLIDRSAIERTKEWIDVAINNGAKVLTGGISNKSVFSPTVLVNTKPEMKVCSEEIFAPVVVIESYKDFGDALDRMNASRYGLQAGLFTNDVGKINQAYEVLDVGGVIVNDFSTYRVDNMPYGGIKDSGFGREGIRYAMEEMSEIKVLVMRNDLN